MATSRLRDLTSLCFLLFKLALVVLPEAGASPPLATDQQPGKLEAWLSDLHFPLPANKTWPVKIGLLNMDLGNVTLTDGSCSALRFEHLESKDMSKGELLHFGLSLRGLTLSCSAVGYNDGNFTSIELSLGSSSLDLAVQVGPQSLYVAPGFPLPLGDINVTSCDASLKFSSISVEGDSAVSRLFNGDLKDIIPSMAGMFMKEPLCKQVKQIVEDRGSDTAMMAMFLAMPLLSDIPPPSLPTPASRSLMDWDDYPPALVLQAMLRERFGIYAGHVVSAMGSKTFDFALGKYKHATLSMLGFRVDGVGPQTLPGLLLDLAGPNISAVADLTNLTVQTRLGVELALPGYQVLEQSLDMSLGMERASITAHALVDKEQLRQAEVEHLAHSSRCFFERASGTGEPDSSLTITGLDAEVRRELKVEMKGGLGAQLAGVLNTFAGALLDGYMPTVQRLVSGYLAKSVHQVNDKFWESIRASPDCTHASMRRGVTDVVARALWIWSGVAFLVAVLALLVRCCILRKPSSLSIFFPCAVASMILLFLFADVEFGATVSLDTAASGKTEVVGPIFSFTLVGMVAHNWEKGHEFMSIVIFLFSGVWPILRLSLLLVCWFSPHFLSEHVRSWFLATLNALGKYGFVQPWFLVLSISVFTVQWSSVGDASMKVFAVPNVGFYAFFGATCFSLVLGFIARRRLLRDREARQTGEHLASICECHEKAQLFSLIGSRRLSASVVIGLAATTVLALLGIFLPSFRFEAEGVATGFLFGSGIEKRYSLFNLGATIASHQYNNAGLLFMEVVFLMLTIAVPLIELAVLTIVFVVPLTLSRQLHLLHACRLLHAWSSLDVAAFVLTAACADFGNMVSTMVMERVGAACAMVQEITNDNCMTADMAPLVGFPFLFLAGVSMFILPKVAVRLGTRAVCALVEELEVKHKPTVQIRSPVAQTGTDSADGGSSAGRVGDAGMDAESSDAASNEV